VLVAVLSDIHGNLEALEAVWADAQAQGIGAALCLGDVVGYGPDPEAVIAFVQDHQILCCRGNHDHGVVHPRDALWFNSQARRGLAMTRALLGETSRLMLAGLPWHWEYRGACGVHGFPPDDIFTYLHGVEDAALVPWLEDGRLWFVGHTHEMAVVTLGEKGVVRRLVAAGDSLALGRGAIVNAGSVGQPRDGTPEAKYVLWDVEAQWVEFRAIAYPAWQTAAKIRELGFPEAWAARLL